MPDAFFFLASRVIVTCYALLAAIGLIGHLRSHRRRAK